MNTKNFKNISLLAALFIAVSIVACTDDEGIVIEPCDTVQVDECQICEVVNGSAVVTDTCDTQGTGDCITKTGLITASETWTADRCYALAGKVVVQSGATLTIEPGTIIKGSTGAGSLASALIISRGATIIAEGTAAQPIIFTSELDNISIGQLTGTNLTEEDNQKWGGLIVLGYAPVSAEDGDTEARIEGIPADEDFGLYGGDNAADNSGILKYISIRHGGASIGEGNEINGLTLGGVGTGTTVEYIEVVANYDDGIECFGGTVNITNAIVAYQGDDGLDIDQNYAGTIENAMVIYAAGDKAMEFDGPEGSTYTDGLFTVNNATFRDKTGTLVAADWKSKAQGTVSNAAFEGFTNFIRVRANYDADNSCAEKADAYQYLKAGSLKLMDSDIVSATAVDSDVFSVYTKVEACEGSIVESDADATFAPNGNAIVTTATRGADQSKFENWTWTAANGKF